MRHRWRFVDYAGNRFLEHGLIEHPKYLLIQAICNFVADTPRWGDRFKVGMERVPDDRSR